MADTETKTSSVKIDIEKANRMLKKLIVKETANIKTKRYNDGEMVRQIKKMIEEEVECY